MKKPAHIHVYYDGDCPLCTVFADTVRTDPTQTVSDITNTADLPAEKEQLLTEIHLYEADGTLRTGADAVLTALALRFSWLTPLSRFIRLPFISTLARGVYFFISKRRKLWFGSTTSRLYWLYLLTLIGTTVGILASFPLWTADRLYPTIPVFSIFGEPAVFTLVLSTLLLTFLVYGAYTYTHCSAVARGVVILLLALIILDITRLQPWVLHFGLMFGLLAFWSLTDALRTKKILDAARLILIAIYFWSGFQKLNTAFYLETFPWFTEPLWSPFGDIGAYSMLAFGVFVPFIEMAFAIGLATRRFRTVSLFGSFAMLLVVLSSLMFGHGWNNIVWSWNIVIFLMVCVLFFRETFTVKEFTGRLRHNLYALPIILICVVVPLGNIFGYTHHYLSWSLYSGHVPTASITLSPTTKASLWQINHVALEDSTIPFTEWSFKTVAVPPYPEVWYFRRAFSYLCTNYPTDESLELAITERSFFLSHQKTITQFSCAEVASLMRN